MGSAVTSTKSQECPSDSVTNGQKLTVGDLPLDNKDAKKIADIIGIFEDEPLWDEVMAKVRAFRERQNAADETRPATK